jgi:hypothetical protein
MAQRAASAGTGTLQLLILGYPADAARGRIPCASVVLHRSMDASHYVDASGYEWRMGLYTNQAPQLEAADDPVSGAVPRACGAGAKT